MSIKPGTLSTGSASAITEDGPVASLPTLDELGRVPRPSRGFWGNAWARFRTNRVSLAALIIVLLIVIFVLSAGLIAEYVTNTTYYATSLTDKMLPVGTNGHPLGTDRLGRDVLTRLAYGGRVSLRVALLSTVFILVIGGTVGAVSGYVAGMRGSIWRFIDPVAMRTVDALLAIPTLIILILVASFHQLGPDSLALMIAIFSWAGVARLVRGEVLSLRQRDYIDAARASGATGARILARHILPNVIPIIIVWASLVIPGLILLEASLSYLGLGVRPPQPSWGNMLQDAKETFRQAPSLVIIPGVMIYITVLCVNLVGTGLRDALDPNLNE